MKVTNAGLQNDAETQDVSFETIFNGTAKVWSNLNGTSTIAERDSFNISGYVDNGTGNYTLTISSDMSDSNYVATSQGCDSSAGDVVIADNEAAPAAGALRVQTTTFTGTDNDSSYCFQAIHGALA